MDILEIEKLFNKLRKAGHGSLIKFDATGTGQPVEGIIFEPGVRRPPGFESGIFVTVPSERNSVYYFDPKASRENGRIIIQKLDAKKEKAEPSLPDDDLIEFEHIRKAPDVKLGGGAVGLLNSRYTCTLDLNKGKDE